MGAEFSWWSLFPPLVGAVVGGGVSLTSTLFMQSRAQKLESAKKDREAKRLAGNLAYFALAKLVGTFEAIENLARHFDQQFKEAEAEGRGASQPYDIYKAIVGAPHVIDVVSANEILFLAKGHGEMIARIGEIQQRARNDEVVAREYSSARRNLDSFMLNYISPTTILDGSRMAVQADATTKTKVDVLQGQLNQIIVPLIVALEEDRNSIVLLVNEYIKIAQSTFGDDFPAKGFEVRGITDNANS